MVYGVFGGCYSDWYVVGYFTNRQDADKYCCICGNGNYYVKTLKDLTNEKDLSKVSLKYCHEVVFDCKDYENKDYKNRWIMREEPERYNCYIDNDLRCNSVSQGGFVGNNWVCFTVNIDHDDRRLAEKIAQDYLAELCSYGDGKIYEKNIKLMNDKFAAPFKEKERIRKEEELKQKELAELERLKAKYESK